MSRLPSPPSMSRADLALRDGSLFANLRYANMSHAQLREAIQILCDKAAVLADAQLVSEHLDNASDAADEGNLVEAGFRLEDAAGAMSGVYAGGPSAEAARERHLELVHDDGRAGL